MRRFSVVVSLILCIVGATATAAQTPGRSEILDPGGHVLEWTGNWTKDPGASTATVDFEGVLMQGTDVLFGVVVYANTLSGAEMRDVFVESFGTSLGNYTSIDAGSDNGVHWELGGGSSVTLYAVFLDGGLGTQSLGYFVVAPSASFASAVSTIQTDFNLNGGMVLRGVNGNGLQERALSSGVQTPSQRYVEDSIYVGNTEVGWSGPWEYDLVNSTVDQATFEQLDEFAGILKLVSYGEFASQPGVGADDALASYADAFFVGAGATNIWEIDAGFLADGTEWQLYRFDLQGMDLALFITGTENLDGAYAITTVTANTAELPVALIEVQEQFSLNRTTSLLEGVDPILVTIGIL